MTDKPRKNKKKVFYTEELGEWICEKIEEGCSVAEICRKYPKKMPDEKSIYRWKRAHPKFLDRFNIAYQTKMYKHIDELYELMNAPLPTPEALEQELGLTFQNPGVCKSYLNAYLQQRRLKIDTLKFLTAKLAPKLVPELSDKIKVEGDSKHTIQVVLPDWSQPARTIEHDEGDDDE